MESMTQLKRRITGLLDLGKCDEARELYELKCIGWWPKSDYVAQEERARFIFLERQKSATKSDNEMERERASFSRSFSETLAARSLAKLDELYRNRPDSVSMSLKDFLHRKLPVVREVVGKFESALDHEQMAAIALPWQNLLIQARAGSGKTRTICARAALAIRDESLIPNQVLILAFNKAAATEVEKRVREETGTDYRNARTFHSLAYRLVKPMEKLLFDGGEEPSVAEQSKFVQRLLHKILNPAFKERMG